MRAHCVRYVEVNLVPGQAGVAIFKAVVGPGLLFLPAADFCLKQFCLVDGLFMAWLCELSFLNASLFESLHIYLSMHSLHSVSDP